MYKAGLRDSHIGKFVRGRIDRRIPRSAANTSVCTDTHKQTTHGPSKSESATPHHALRTTDQSPTAISAGDRGACIKKTLSILANRDRTMGFMATSQHR